jgi:uncharacterized membrane protein HdeD (DUF308 family)
MIASLTNRWWVFLVQGVVMFVLAVLAFTQPATLIQFIGAYAVIDGVLKVFSGLSNQRDDQVRWSALIIGVLSVIVGVLIWTNLLPAAGLITYAIAAWAVITGLLFVVWALRLRQAISDEWTMLILGLLSIIFGLLVFNNVLAGALTLAWIFAISMVVGAILGIALAFRIRNIGARLSMAR